MAFCPTEFFLPRLPTANEISCDFDTFASQLLTLSRLPGIPLHSEFQQFLPPREGSLHARAVLCWVGEAPPQAGQPSPQLASSSGASPGELAWWGRLRRYLPGSGKAVLFSTLHPHPGSSEKKKKGWGGRKKVRERGKSGREASRNSYRRAFSLLGTRVSQEKDSPLMTGWALKKAIRGRWAQEGSAPRTQAASLGPEHDKARDLVPSLSALLRAYVTRSQLLTWASVFPSVRWEQWLLCRGATRIA